MVHGANAPLLGKLIKNEMDKERRILKGEMGIERTTITFEDAVPSNNLTRFPLSRPQSLGICSFREIFE